MPCQFHFCFATHLYETILLHRIHNCTSLELGLVYFCPPFTKFHFCLPVFAPLFYKNSTSFIPFLNDDYHKGQSFVIFTVVSWPNYKRAVLIFLFFHSYIYIVHNMLFKLLITIFFKLFLQTNIYNQITREKNFKEDFSVCSYILHLRVSAHFQVRFLHLFSLEHCISIANIYTEFSSSLVM